MKNDRIIPKIAMFISLLYFFMLLHNVFAAKVLPSAFSLILFALTCPFLFIKLKEKHYSFFKKIQIICLIPSAIILMYLSVSILNGSLFSFDEPIPVEEQHYIDTVLSKITNETTKEDVIALLGTPDRDMVLKVNWRVTINEKNSRIGVIFSATTGKAQSIVLDGGVGRFYYKKELE